MLNRLIPKYLATTLALSVGVVCIVTLALYFNYNNFIAEFTKDSIASERALLTQQLQQRGVEILENVEIRLREAGVLSDGAEAAKILERAVSDYAVTVEFTLTDNQGRTIAASGPSAADPQGSSFAVNRPVITDGLVVGTLSTVVDPGMLSQGEVVMTEVLSSAERKYRLRGALWVAAATFLMLPGLAYAAYLLGRELVNPINALTQQANRIREGNYTHKLDVDRDDELGELALSFNSMQDQLRQTTISRDYVNNVVNNISDAVVVTAPDGTITRINPATTALLEYRADELIGKPIEKLISDSHLNEFKNLIRGRTPIESVLKSKSGKTIPVSLSGTAIETDNPMFEGSIYTAQNVTERKRAERRIRFLARIDALTKVPNRMQFQHLLQRAIARARRSKDLMALLYLDVDQFKDINDTFGHLAGDTTLETLTRRLTEILPPSTVVGRLAGDEFAVILDHLDNSSDLEATVAAMADSLLKRLADPINVQGQEVFMTASMGIALYPADANNVIDLIRNADAALYNAKKAGGNAYEFYSPEMNVAVVERLMMKSKLRRAFERNELLVHYQPKFDLRDGTLAGAEALVRWELPERGMILPSEFIPLAEETNLIIEIGEWVLDRVCKDYRIWQDSIKDPGRIAINLSLKQLKQLNFVQRVSDICRNNTVSPTCVEFEITETTMMEDTRRTVRTLDELYGLGIHLAIDDFGTGFSSLSALQQFPIQTLKIDKSFVRDAATDPDDATIVATIIDMGRSLAMDVVAEGVETEEQLNFLQTLRCNYVQGMLFGQPMNCDDFLALILSHSDIADESTGTHRALFA